MAAGPLAGIRVLELAAVVMGPYGTQLLGDLGAEIIKIETSTGDGSRVMRGGPHPELSGIALNLHRNKRSIGIDVKQPVAGPSCCACWRGATSSSPTCDRLHCSGCGWTTSQSLAAAFPRLVHCQAQGFASDGEESGRPAYDDIIQALAGFPQLNGLAFGQTRFLPGVVADKVAGLFIAQGVLAALVARASTGLGQHVEVPMFDAALAFNLVEHLARAAVPGEPAGYNRSLTLHRGPHRTLDGYVAMMPYTDEHWTTLFTAVGRQELLDRPCFADHRSRLMQADEVYGLLAQIVAERTTDEWIELCSDWASPWRRCHRSTTSWLTATTTAACCARPSTPTSARTARSRLPPPSCRPRSGRPAARHLRPELRARRPPDRARDGERRPWLLRLVLGDAREGGRPGVGEPRASLEAVHAAYDMNAHFTHGAPQFKQLTDEVIDAFGIAGPPSYCLERIEQLKEMGITGFFLQGAGLGADEDAVARSHRPIVDEVIPNAFSPA